VKYQHVIGYKDMTAILKSHKISYVKMRSAYKRSTRSDSIGFLQIHTCSIIVLSAIENK